MPWLRKARPVLFVLGGLLLVGSLLGARLLATGTADETPKTANPTNGKGGSGPVVIGFVDTLEPSPVGYGLPPVLQSGLLAKISVKESQAVKAGEELFAFDTTIQEADLKTAEEAVKVAQAEVNAAQTKRAELLIQIEAQQVAVDAATSKAYLSERALEVGKQQFRDDYKTRAYPPNEWDARLKTELKILELESVYQPALVAKKAEEAKLSALKKTDVEVLVKKAEAGVAQAKSLAAKARSAVELCTVRAKTDGVVEQINVSPGTVLGISTRLPVLWLIPDGPRIVRAEVEAEFAHRVTPDMYGRSVTIYDHNDPKLMYRGTFKRISGSFLQKRSGGDNLLGNETKVLEAVVAIDEPLPAGLPPLRIGQKVKVNFGR